jgi:hypothetical protein
LVRRPEGRDRSEDLDFDWRIILEWIFETYDGNLWTRCIWLRVGTIGGSFVHGNEPSDSIECGEFID